MIAFIQTDNSSDKTTAADGVNHISVLRGTDPDKKCKVFSSNLRRAISTIVYGFQGRWKQSDNTEKKDKRNMVTILDSLQEISCNPDTLCITPSHQSLQASWIEKSYRSKTLPSFDFQFHYDQYLDMNEHAGNKPLNTNGLKRMTEFCRQAFDESICPEKYIIVGGHSLWFRTFFRNFLPYSVSHIGKNKKIVNCGIVTFELMRANTAKHGIQYMIDPKTIQVVYGGFK
jgi:hypothetical protein